MRHDAVMKDIIAAADEPCVSGWQYAGAWNVASHVFNTSQALRTRQPST